MGSTALKNVTSTLHPTNDPVVSETEFNWYSQTSGLYNYLAKTQFVGLCLVESADTISVKK